MALKLTKFDSARYLTDDESVAIYLGDAFAQEDAHGIVDALQIVVRARGGISILAKAAGIEESVIQKALLDTPSPDLAAILTVLHALGVRLTTELVA